MSTGSCCRCHEWSDTPETVQQILTREFVPCTGCSQQPVIHTLAHQYVARKPRWWVVNGHQAVPIWIVDLVRRKFKF